MYIFQAFVIHWSEALETEVSPYNIDVLLLTPSYICTGMTAFSDEMSRPSLTVPSPTDYATSSLKIAIPTHMLDLTSPYTFSNEFSGAPRVFSDLRMV